MPGRDHLLTTGSIYHVFNKTIDNKQPFLFTDICQKFCDIVVYYRSTQSILRFSQFDKQPKSLKQTILTNILNKKTFRIRILAYCLMPTHYHFLLRQEHANGVSTFISLIQNSFTRFYNLKHDRKGPLFLHRFKSKPIQTESLIKHVSRYIHLNPFSSNLIKDKELLQKYPWSSFHEYFEQLKPISDVDFVLSYFNNNVKSYNSFILNNAEHQRMIEECKYTQKWHTPKTTF